MCFFVNIAKRFDNKAPVASVDLLFLIKSNLGWFLLQRVDLVILSVIYTLLVETIPTRFYWLTCRNEKLVQKPLQQRLLDLILGFWLTFWYFHCEYLMNGGSDPYKPYHFLKDRNKNFQVYIWNCFNRLRFLAEVSPKLQKMQFYGQLKDHDSGRKHGN